MCTEPTVSKQAMTNLLDTGSIVSLEASSYFVGGSLDVPEPLTICIFSIGAHARNREDLLILLYTLLQLAKQDSQTCATLVGCSCAGREVGLFPTCCIVRRPEGTRECAHRIGRGLI